MKGMNVVQNRTIQIRMTSEEKEQILFRMQADGFHNLSVWIREKLLNNSARIELEISEMYRLLLAKEERRSVTNNLSNSVYLRNYCSSAVFPPIQVHIISYEKQDCNSEM